MIFGEQNYYEALTGDVDSGTTYLGQKKKSATDAFRKKIC